MATSEFMYNVKQEKPLICIVATFMQIADDRDSDIGQRMK